LRLPVAPEELRRRFPSLTDDELHAWTAVTGELLARPDARGRRLTEVLVAARRGRETEAAGAKPEPDESRALLYVRALGKMQGR
jgi:hypothetical protein